MSQVDSTQTGDDAVRRREQRAWCWYDWANSSFYTSVISVFLALYLTDVAVAAAKASGQPCPSHAALEQCDISLFGLTFPAGSLWGYLLSFATLIQVVVLPVAGAIADRTQNKKRMLATFTFLGAGATVALAMVEGTSWELGAVLLIIANIGYGTAVVIYYSFLPEIAAADERDGLSARGWAFGYLGGGLSLALNFVVYSSHEALGLTEGQAVRFCFVIAGLWWAAFTLIPLRVLRKHQAPQGTERGVKVLTAGFSQLRDTIRQARALPLTLAFLGTYLIYTDGIATVVNVAGQYGDRELGLERETLIATILIVQFVAFVGGMLHGLVAKRIGAKRTIQYSLVVWVTVIAAAFFVQAGDQIQFYGVAVGIGMVLGGTNALSRSLFSQMIPRGREAQYYSLYEIGERGTSWLGPLLFAGIGQATGSLRWGIISLVIFFVIGLVLISLVPVRRAIEAAGNTAPTVL